MPSLYVHVPWCHAKCVYCDFYSITDFRGSENFRALVARERDLLLRDLAPGDREFGSLFFGGGTPTALDASTIGGIIEDLSSRLRLAPDAEITVECNPGTTDQALFADLRSAGVTRLSIGIQSFFDEDLRALDRIHDARQARDAIASARRAGFDNFSIDLMFSLPGQTLERWIHTLSLALDHEVPHLSCYSLTVEPSTPLDHLVRHGEVRLPDIEVDADLFLRTMEVLNKAGYEHYEVSNYAKPGFRSRHNLSYWLQEDYLGFGPSAASTWGGRRWRHPRSVAEWTRSLQADSRPEREVEILTPEQRAIEAIFLGLRRGVLNLEDFRERYDRDLAVERKDVLTGAKKDGLIRISDGRLELTHRGFLVCDELCARLA